MSGPWWGGGTRSWRLRLSSIGALCLVGAVLAACGTSGSPGIPSSISAVAGRAQQVADDTVYLPVEVNGRWVLSGPPGTWLQPSISATSTPWRWDYPCAVLDPSLVDGIKGFMKDEIARTFSGHDAALLQAKLINGLGPSISAGCHSPDPNVAEGPPGPILDRLVIQNVVMSGSLATVIGQVHVTDWQGGVSHTPVPNGGRRVTWRKVPGVLDATYSLRIGSDDNWRVTSFTSSFAPGHMP
jgi:hypothetical protein